MTQEGQTPSSRRQLLLMLAQLAGLVVVLVGAGLVLDWEQVGIAMSSLTRSSLMVFLGLMMAMRGVAAWRWRWVATHTLGYPPLALSFYLRASLLSEFAVIWLQTAIGGEAVRVWRIAAHGLDRGQALASVVLDRLVGTSSMVLVCLPFVLVSYRYVPWTDVRVPAWHWLVMILVGAVLIGLLASRVTAVRTLVDRGRRVVEDPRRLVIPVVASIAGMAVLFAAHWLGIPALRSHPWEKAAALVLLPRLARAIPASLFGLSAVEGSTVLLGKAMRFDNETLIVMVALNLTVKYLASFLGIGFEVTLNGTRFFKVVRAARR